MSGVRKFFKLINSLSSSYKIRGVKFYTLPVIRDFKSSFSVDKSSNIYIHGKLRIGAGTSGLCRSSASVSVRRNATLHSHGNVNIGRGVTIIVNDNAYLSIGENTYFAGDSKIYSSKSIVIGKNCAISWGLTLIDSDFHEIISDGKAHEKSKPIIIGDNVWIGANCTILKGVTIGDNAVIAAGSVVVKNVLPSTIVAGNPAKTIRENISWNL